MLDLARVPNLINPILAKPLSPKTPKVEGSAGKRAASATLLNQAMSFAAVAGVTMRLGTEAVPEYP